jgi:aminoglycoside 6'-N-acetyltransferase I
MLICDLTAENGTVIEQVAAMLVASFAEHWPGSWSDVDSARAEVMGSFAPERISRVALDDHGEALGWIGGIPQYRGHVWELHPLVVRVDWQGQGIGRAWLCDRGRTARRQRSRQARYFLGEVGCAARVNVGQCAQR